METQSSIELQDWQKEILDMAQDTFELKPQQKEMIGEVVVPFGSNPLSCRMGI
jgi:hypothetical protein